MSVAKLETETVTGLSLVALVVLVYLGRKYYKSLDGVNPFFQIWKSIRGGWSDLMWSIDNPGSVLLHAKPDQAVTGIAAPFETPETQNVDLSNVDIPLSAEGA